MIRRALLLSLAVVALVAGPAAAQDYDGTTASATVEPDGDIVVNASGFNPNATVTYTVDLDGTRVLDGSVQSDAAGDVNFTVEYQGDGTYTIRMTDGENTQVLNVTVDRAAGAPGTAGQGTTGTASQAGALPATGSDSSLPLAQTGIALMMIGGVAIYAAKRRRAKAFA